MTTRKDFGTVSLKTLRCIPRYITNKMSFILHYTSLHYGPRYIVDNIPRYITNKMNCILHYIIFY